MAGGGGVAHGPCGGMRVSGVTVVAYGGAVGSGGLVELLRGVVIGEGGWWGVGLPGSMAWEGGWE